jgi:hypothetical protein
MKTAKIIVAVVVVLALGLIVWTKHNSKDTVLVENLIVSGGHHYAIVQSLKSIYHISCESIALPCSEIHTGKRYTFAIQSQPYQTMMFSANGRAWNIDSQEAR